MTVVLWRQGSFPYIPLYSGTEHVVLSVMALFFDKTYSCVIVSPSHLRWFLLPLIGWQCSFYLSWMLAQ